MCKSDGFGSSPSSFCVNNSDKNRWETLSGRNILNICLAKALPSGFWRLRLTKRSQYDTSWKRMEKETGWWFQPIWKICSSNWKPSPICGVKIARNIWVASTEVVTMRWRYFLKSRVHEILPTQQESKNSKGKSLQHGWRLMIPVKSGDTHPKHMCQGWSTPYLGDKLIPPFIGILNPYNGYVNSYYWVDDHPLVYGNNGSWSTRSHILKLIMIEFPSSSSSKQGVDRYGSRHHYSGYLLENQHGAGFGRWFSFQFWWFLGSR